MADAEVLVSIALYRPAWGAAPSCENGQCWLLLALPFFYALISVPQTNVFIHSGLRQYAATRPTPSVSQWHWRLIVAVLETRPIT